MAESFTKTLLENEDDLKRIRNFYLPFIGKRIITGYNLYCDPCNYEQNNLYLNYFHSDLRYHDSHFIELRGRVKAEGFEEKIVINNKLVEGIKIVERSADYLTKSDWNDPQFTRYFDFDGNELLRSDAKDLDEVVAESIQYDLSMKIANESELRKLVNFFKGYGSKFRLDRAGRIMLEENDFVENHNAIVDAWKIPLLLVMSDKKPKNLIDFLAVNQIYIDEIVAKKQALVSTLIKNKTKEFLTLLKNKCVEVRVSRRYVLRAFVESYLDA